MNGKSRYSILISSEATTQDEKAAVELQRWLQEMTGAKFGIFGDIEQVKDESRIISIGFTDELKEAGLEVFTRFHFFVII